MPHILRPLSLGGGGRESCVSVCGHNDSSSAALGGSYIYIRVFRIIFTHALVFEMYVTRCESHCCHLLSRHIDSHHRHHHRIISSTASDAAPSCSSGMHVHNGHY